MRPSVRVGSGSARRERAHESEQATELGFAPTMVQPALSVLLMA